jgi:hypothetical protein
MYGSSTRNIRIESWWRVLRVGGTDRWIVSVQLVRLLQSLTRYLQSFFNKLASYALFIEGNEVDQIALYAVYTTSIQDDIAVFVQL